MDHAELNFLCAKTLDDMLSRLGTLTNGNADKARGLLKNTQDALELLAKVGIKPELNEIQDVIFTHLVDINPEIPEDIKDQLKRFATYINLDVDLILNRKQPSAV